MDEDSIEVGEFERKHSFANSTAWASRVASKFKGRRTYGRRGSDIVANKKYVQNTSLVKNYQRKQKVNKEGDHEEGIEVGDGKQNDSSRSPWSSKVSEHSDVPSPPPRRIKKWRTISGESPVMLKPNLPSKLMRSQSVSALTPQRISSTFARSVSTASSFGSSVVEERRGYQENFNPNSFSTINDVHCRDLLGENTSPKRSAVAEANKKDRKKCKPTNRSFVHNNDFSALSGRNENDNDNRLKKNNRSKIPLTSDSFSDLARNYGEVQHVWNTSTINSCPSNWNESKDGQNGRSYLTDLFSPESSSLHDETMDGTESVLSSSMSMTSSTRKRGVCKSQFLIDESPVVRSRSRILSPLPVRTPDSSSIINSINSKNRTASKLMNISFCSAQSEKKVVRAELDVTMSDDSVESDISVDSEDEIMAAISPNTFHGLKPNSSTKITKVFEPEKATVDDVIKHMSSYEDIQFLSRSLKQNFEGQYGCLSWNIAPPVAWTAKRRDAFFQATRTLGFTFRAGGGNVSYIQISKTRGTRLLPLLNCTLATFDEKSGVRRLNDPEPMKSKELVFALAKKELHPANTLRFTPKELTSNSWWPNSVDRTTEELSEIMSKLNMNPRPSEQRENERENFVFNVNDCFENRNKHRHDMPTKERNSLEYHSNSTDLNSQLCGATPTSLRLQRRPPRMSSQSTSSKTTVSTTFNSNPPVFTDSDLLKPAHISKHTKCGMNSNEYLLTPLVGRHIDVWGSRPFGNHDWGTSDSCEPFIIKNLFLRFSRTRRGDGLNEGLDERLTKDLGLSCLGLDFDSDSQFYDEFDSPTSSSSFVDARFHEPVPSHSSICLAENNSYSDERSNDPFSSRVVRRRQTTFAKHRRMSLFASAVNPAKTFLKQRKSLFVGSKKKILLESAPEFFSQHTTFVMKESSCDHRHSPKESPLDDDEVLRVIFDFLEERELLLVVGVVSRKWSDVATHSHANLMLSSVAHCDVDKVYDDNNSKRAVRSWEYLTTTFPWACFLSEGAFKRVYKVFNHNCQEEEAISVMDVQQIHSTGNINVVGAELAVSVLLSSLVRRGICPNFVATRGMFSCHYEPPDNHWGTSSNKKPKGALYSPTKITRRPKEPKQSGVFQYIRMELCGEGDAEEFLKRQPNELLLPSKSRDLLFQISFALYAAAEKFSLKHYDVKLLNIFLQRVPKKNGGEVILRYGLGEHTFALRSTREEAIIAKLADYGTANVDCVTNGQNVTIAQFTTLENTPPDFLILGDQALQGHGHDCFGLGLCMLHLFTGHAPYEEILVDVTCPSNLKKELRRIWENEEETQYSVVRSIVLAEVYKDEDGHIIEGEADETLYDTLYKYLVLFGIPDNLSPTFLNSKVMSAVKSTLLPEARQRKGRGRNRKGFCDAKQFISDRRKFSLTHGNNRYIARARTALFSMDGGMDLLQSLVQFDPQNRASALDVLNSTFMSPLREIPNDTQCHPLEAEILSFTAFSTQN